MRPSSQLPCFLAWGGKRSLKVELVEEMLRAKFVYYVRYWERLKKIAFFVSMQWNSHIFAPAKAQKKIIIIN